ncbi:MAG: hypothetical protein QG568_650 [Patescibacteria group bacterium]|nr:hypothetical protein [Patescibacteria group bacterium]
MKVHIITGVVGFIVAVTFWFTLQSPEDTQRRHQEAQLVKEAVHQFMAGEEVDASRFPWWSLSDGRIDAALLTVWRRKKVITPDEENALRYAIITVTMRKDLTPDAK